MEYFQCKLMSYLFCGCKNLKYLPNISKWDTSYVVTMDNLFCIAYH